MVYTINEIFSITRGTLLKVSHTGGISKLLLDSRKLSNAYETLFIAIKGKRNDGHSYIEELYKKGVRNFIVEHSPNLILFPDANFIQVKDSIVAMQQIAAFHRQRFKYPVVGITGSNGKTIVKEWLYQLLNTSCHVVKSPKSYNSQIGVPLSVWNMSEQHEIGVFEAGISQPNEMDKLERILKPNVGIFTNIGQAHDSGFLNIRQKINEKLQLFAFSEYVVYCHDHSELNNAILNFKAKIVNDDSDNRFKLFSWSMQESSEANLKITKVIRNNGFTHIEGHYQDTCSFIEIPFTDQASIENAINCWAALIVLNKVNAAVIQQFKHLSAVSMRLELKEGNNNCSLINDSYSNDISSLIIAIEFLQQQQLKPKKTLILSDILESGKNEFELYEEVVAIIQRFKITKFIGIGKSLKRQQKQFEPLENIELFFYEDTASFLSTHPFDTFQDEAILLKGARVYAFERISALFEKKAHETVLEVNLSAINNNLAIYRKQLPTKTKVMAMVKAFSYGSGSYEIAKQLENNQIDYLAVAYADEGVELRQAGITTPIMVMCPERNSFDTIIKNNLEPEIYSIEILQELLNQIELYYTDSVHLPIRIHLELETGMNRLGFDVHQLEALANLLQTHASQIKVASIFSHLAASESADFDAFTKEQIARFESMSSFILQHCPYPVLRHILNSGGIVRHPEAVYDMVRLGIGLYGSDSSNTIQNELEVVSTLKSTILQIKEISPNDTVGYSRKGQLKTGSKIATIGLGYADGLHRKLGNGVGKMELHGQLVSIVGSICMDMCMLDISEIPNAKVGDEVVVFGKNPSIQQLAEWEGTIPYEILTNISKRVKRVYFEE